MKRTEAIARLKTLLIPEFLANLSEVVALSEAIDEDSTFYVTDWYEVANLVEGLHKFAGVEVQDLDVADLEDDAS